MNKKLLTMITTGAIVVSNMNFAFAEIPECSIPEGEKPIFEKIPNAHIPEIEMLMEEFDDEAVEPGDDIMDDVISGEEYEEEESEADDSMDEEPIDEEIIDEAEMERLEREEHEKELAEKEQDDDEIMDEIEEEAEKYDKENEEDTIGGIDDDYYDVGEEPEIKDEDPAENIPDEEEKEEVKKSNNKEVVSNESNSNTNVSNNTAGAISQDKEVEHQVVTNAGDTKVDEDKVVKELDEPQGKGNSSGNPKTGDIGIIGSITGMIVGLGGIILRKRL